MPGIPTNKVPNISGAGRGSAPHLVHQEPGLATGSTGNLNPKASDFAPGAALVHVDKGKVSGEGAVKANRISQDGSVSEDRPAIMKDLIHDVNILAQEVLKLRREKTAIEESLKNVSWAVTFRPLGDQSGLFQTQTVAAPMSSTDNSAGEFHYESLFKETKQEKIEGGRISGTSDTTAIQDNDTGTDTTVDGDGDHVRCSIEDPARQYMHRQPLAIRYLGPLSPDKLDIIPDTSTMETFSLEFLLSLLGGNEHSPSLYYAPPSKRTNPLPTHTWYALDSRVEPYLPEKPGAHGARITPFFNLEVDEDDDEGPSYKNIPIFVCASPWLKEKNENLYVYYGSYSQHRWSDKLDYDKMVEAVPNNVKMYWADQLSNPGRPEWLTKALMKTFWPVPAYKGQIPSSGDPESSNAVHKDMDEYMEELKEWEKEATMKAKLLKKENILKAFDNADADDPPGLRLWWEYFQCVGWDKRLYDALVKRKSTHNGS